MNVLFQRENQVFKPNILFVFVGGERLGRPILPPPPPPSPPKCSDLSIYLSFQFYVILLLYLKTYE